MSGLKYDLDKVRLEMLSPIAIFEIAKAFTYGAKKYTTAESIGDHNWRKGLKVSRVTGAMLRHSFLFLAGEDKDKESGLLHLASIGACVCFLIEYYYTKPELDDRYKLPQDIIDLMVKYESKEV